MPRGVRWTGLRGRHGTSAAEPRSCERCAARFVPTRKETARGWGRFCSVDCSNAAQRGCRARSPVERFWERVEKAGSVVRDELGPCWDWTGSTNNKGYGQLRLAKRGPGSLVLAHRFSWELANGRPLAPEEQCRHACDRPSCVNPAHLSPGTPLDNSADMINRGRSPRGERAGGVKLTEDCVRNIRRLAADGASHTAIAKSYCVSRTAVSDIISGRNWGHVA